MDRESFGKWGDKLKFSYLVLTLFAALGAFARFPVESKVWAFIYLVTFLWIAFELNKLLRASMWIYLIVLFPLLAMVSTFWSEAPVHTFRISIHVFMTVLIAIWVGLSFSPYKVFLGLAAACTIGLIASLLLTVVPVIPAYSAGDNFFIGIFAQKNVFGRVLLLLSISILVIGAKYRRLWIAWPLALLIVFPLLQVQSATSTVFYFLSLLFPVMYYVLTASSGARQALVLSGLSFLLIGWGFWAVGDLDLLSPILESLGKDTTFTGRTYLWDTALRMFELNPMVGIGYDAFWNAGNIEETQQIWDNFGVLNGFHNTFFEVLVALGVMGVIILLITVFAFLVQMFRWMLDSKSAESLGAMVLITMTLFMSNVEIMSFRELDAFYLLPCVFYVISISYFTRARPLRDVENSLTV